MSLRITLKNIGIHTLARVKEVCGAEGRYCIRGSYRHRQSYSYDDDTALKDEWQREVYLRAAELMKTQQLATVYDVGCGSGYKLINYLGQWDTFGFEVPETLRFLRRTYPNRKWRSAAFSNHSHPPADLVICADVIEHVTDPIQLMNFILSVSRKWIVLSTPDRNLVYSRFSPHRLGPPANRTHIREWSFEEFGLFVRQHVDVLEHVISNRKQGTQMVVATRRSAARLVTH
jgi:SAM-dependent methyltransferase